MTSRYIYSSIELDSGPLSFRIGDEAVEINVGDEDSNMFVHLDFSEDAIVTLLSIFEYWLPVIRWNRMLIRMGSIAKAFQTEEVSVVMGQPYAPNLEDERRRMNAERALCEHARKHY